jgi:hypothetical protein
MPLAAGAPWRVPVQEETPDERRGTGERSRRRRRDKGGPGVLKKPTP